MKRFQTAMATLVMMTAGAVFAYSQTAPTNPAPGSGEQQGQRKGRKLGKQDGSGPRHAPGTGGGTGAGHRRGRR
jgi:hypothetical protein